MANYARKPTVGLVSRARTIPVSTNQDSPGPVAKCVRDLTLLLNVLAGPDEGDLASVELKAKIQHDYTIHLSCNFNGLKFGVSSPWYFLSRENIRDSDGADEVRSKAWAGPDFYSRLKQILERVEWALRQMVDAGADILRTVELETLQEILELDPDSVQSGLLYRDHKPWQHFDLLTPDYDFKFGLEDYLKTLSHIPFHTLAQIIQYNKDHPDTETMPGLSLWRGFGLLADAILDKVRIPR